MLTGWSVTERREGSRIFRAESTRPPNSVADIFKRVAGWVGMSAKQVGEVSGHSIRVGATQDLLVLNIELASVIQAGRWKSTRMPMRYGDEALAGRGAEWRGRRRRKVGAAFSGRCRSLCNVNSRTT
jgi:hypothetical protein